MTQQDERIQQYYREESALKPEYRWKGDGPPPARWKADDGTIVYRSYADYCEY